MPYFLLFQLDFINGFPITSSRLGLQIYVGWSFKSLWLVIQEVQINSFPIGISESWKLVSCSKKEQSTSRLSLLLFTNRDPHSPYILLKQQDQITVLTGPVWNPFFCLKERRIVMFVNNEATSGGLQDLVVERSTGLLGIRWFGFLVILVFLRTWPRN